MRPLLLRNCVIVLLFLCAPFVASATEIAGSTFNTACVYRQADTVVTLRPYYSETFVDSLGNVVGGGGVDGRSVVFSNWKVPAAAMTTTYADLTRYHLARRPVNPDTEYAAARVTTLTGAATTTSHVIIGANKNSVARSSAAKPMFPGPNKPQVGRVFKVTSHPYNAVCDGSTDDTAAINAAVTAAARVGGSISIPPSAAGCKIGTAAINVPIIFEGSLTGTNGQTTTLTKSITAPPRIQIFRNFLSGQGTISFTGNRSLTEIYAQWWGAVGDGVVNDTQAVRAAGSSIASGMTLNFLTGTYKVNFAEGTSLITLTGKSGIRIKGNGATILDTNTYTFTPDPEFTPMFTLDKCTDVSVDGLNYLGPAVSLAKELGYKGGTFVYAKNGSQNITVNAYIENARYGVASGRYSDQTVGNNKGFTVNLRTKSCGYPIAHYLAENVQGTIVAENTHRAAYLAGVIGVDLHAFFKNQYIADIQVMLTDAKTGKGTSRGCKDVKIEAVDMGSTVYTTNSWAAGISLSRVDPGITYENINVRFNVRGTNTIATKLGGFIVVGTGTGYPFDWEQSITLRNIKVSGIVDRSGQSTVGNGAGEIYFYTDGGGSHYATVDNIQFENVIIKDASTPNPRDNYFIAPGLVNQAEFRLCNFSTVGLLVQTNSKSRVSFIDSVIKYTHRVAADAGKMGIIERLLATLRSSRYQIQHSILL